MPTRRDRVSHVRPRQETRSRPSETARIKAPDPYRVRRYRGIDARRRRVAEPARFGLALAVVLVGLLALFTAGGAIGPLAAAFGHGLEGFVGALAFTPEPASSEPVATVSPIIATPENPYTNQPSVELRVTIPADVVGNDSAKVRVYLALEGLTPSPIADVPVGSTTRLTALVDLTPGRNDVSATVIRDGVESEQSPVVTYYYDQEPPAITLSEPADGATIEGETVTLTGATEPASNLVARNEANGASVTALAGADGGFTMSLPLAAGPNGIRIDATDPAGNAGNLVISVRQGSGTMAANLTASAYRISAGAPPPPLQLTVLVTDPNGSALEGAKAYFTLQVPGLAPISNELVTGADGRAVFTAPLVGAISAGAGAGTVLVSHDQYGQATGKVTLTFVP